MRPLPLLLGSLLIFASATAPLLRADDAFAPSKQAPAWAASAVWYQIFPDRFRDGDLKNEPTRSSLETPIMAGRDWHVSPWTADWYSRSDWEQALGTEFYKQGVFDRRYGGDLQGMLDKLPYLADLGVNALYFCPLFYARSLHKYDGNSYHHVDPYFGPDPVGDFALMDQETSDPSTWHWTAADKLFLRVVKEAHMRGMKVIMDGVFNHTGRDFFAFKNIREKQEKSPYKDWYIVRGFDDPDTVRNEFEYDGWWGHKTLPIFASAKGGKDMAPGPKDYIFNSTRRWMNPDNKGSQDGIDGWRLDVADERPTEFWAEWNALVRQLNPQAYTTAETWKDPRPMILDGGFSATMNYFGFAIPVKGWLVDNRVKPSQFAKLIDNRRNALPKADAYVMQNLLDSHDTDRLASMIVNGGLAQYTDPEGIDYNNNNDLRDTSKYSIRKPSDRDRAVQRLVVLMQMTYVGAPMVYYGDEAGMWGAHDPDNRQPMVWADLKYEPQAHDPRKGSATVSAQPIAFDGSVFDAYKQAIALRKAHPVLNTGDFALLAADDAADTLVFSRGGGADLLVVAINRSEEARTVSFKAPAGVAKPAVVFTSGSTSGTSAKAEGDNLSITLPALTGAVIGATP